MIGTNRYFVTDFGLIAKLFYCHTWPFSRVFDCLVFVCLVVGGGVIARNGLMNLSALVAFADPSTPAR